MEAHRSLTDRLPSRAGAALGSLLGEASGRLTRVRRSRKPLHPVGRVTTATLTRSGGSRRSGVDWLDEDGVDEVLVRVSRAVGLPSVLPDIYGLALRVPVGDRCADLLLAGTGLGRLTRFLLTPGYDVGDRPLTTLLPYRGPRGPLLLAAKAAEGGAHDELTFDLLWAEWHGQWTRFASLVVGTGAGSDVEVSFDPVLHPLPGLEWYDWVRRLREPAYRAARVVSGRRT